MKSVKGMFTEKSYVDISVSNKLPGDIEIVKKKEEIK